MKITIEIKDQTDNDAAAICAWLDMVMRDEGLTIDKISWSG